MCIEENDQQHHQDHVAVKLKNEMWLKYTPYKGSVLDSHLIVIVDWPALHLSDQLQMPLLHRRIIRPMSRVELGIGGHGGGGPQAQLAQHLAYVKVVHIFFVTGKIFHLVMKDI